MNILILGGVAAGTKTAAKLKREDRSLNVTILTKDKDISYAGCGLPYYVGGLIENREELIVNTPESYAALTGVEVLTGREAISVDSEAKTVVVRCTDTGEEEIHSYDRLVIATGASQRFRPLWAWGKRGSTPCGRLPTPSVFAITSRNIPFGTPWWWAAALSAWRLRRICSGWGFRLQC